MDEEPQEEEEEVASEGPVKAENWTDYDIPKGHKDC